MQFWKEMEGKSFAGRYTLGALLRSAGQSAWFAAKDDQQKPCVIFVAESSNEDDPKLKNLEAASRVKQANVIAIDRTGRVRLGDGNVVYALEEVTEENLGEVLRERPLTSDETTLITESLVAGLTAIHEQGLAHGQVNPQNIWASGETLKLSSDCLQKVTAESRADAVAQDTGDLGATVFEALTQRKLTSPDDPAIEKLQVPFRSIVHSAVIGRWGLADIAIALKKPALEELRHPIPTATEQTKPKFAEIPAVRPAAKAEPVSPVIPAVERREEAVAPAAGGRRKSLLIFALIALLAAVGIAWYFFSNRTAAPEGGSDNGSAASTPAAPVADTASAPSTPTPSTSETAAPATPMSAAVPIPGSTSVAAAPESAIRGDHKIWRVVVYTFANQGAAQRKVTVITAAHPDLKPEVFSATGHGPWLVVVGGPMDRQQAFHMRDQVRSEGMPHDSYAQNYTH